MPAMLNCICFLLVFSSLAIASGQSFDIAMLNEQDTLYEKGDCMLFLYAMTAKDTQVRIFIHKKQALKNC